MRVLVLLKRLNVCYVFHYVEISWRRFTFKYVVALSEPLPEDKWDGATGFIHQVVNDNYLSSHEDPTELEFYMCGPPPMITACENMLFDLGVEEDQIAYDVFG